MNHKNIISFTNEYLFNTRKLGRSADFTNLRYVPAKTVAQQLDKNSKACEYFGVNSPENIVKNIKHQEKLNKANETWRINSYSYGNIIDYGVVSLKNIETVKEILHKSQGRGVYGRPWTLIDEIKSQGAMKITFADEMFGIDSCAGTHTIGFVTKDNYLYVLDSLGEQTKELRDFHTKIRKMFSDADFKDIIFSSKAQQPLNEFTCNNWTFANIKSVLSEIYGQNKNIRTTDELNKILREDINNILKEQYECALWY